MYGRKNVEGTGLWGSIDSDFAEDMDKRRSFTGYMFFLNGSLASWKASLQHVVALSTTKEEYTVAIESVIWLRGLLGELGLKQELVTISCDRSSALHLCKNPAHHEKTKHRDIKLHFIRNEISKRVIRMIKVYIDTTPQTCLQK